MADDPREDVQWFLQLSDKELESYLEARGSLRVSPVQRDLCVDSRSFSGPLEIVHGLAINQIHVAAIKTASPAAPIGVFFHVPPSRGLNLTIDGDLDKTQLTATDRTTFFPSPFGARGVASLSLSAENQWKSLTSYITEQSLQAASLSLSTTVYGSENAGDKDCSPQFTPLPRLMPAKVMSAKEITAFYMDRKQYVTALVKCRFGNKIEQLLGELQLAFVCFHILGCMRSLEHWICLLREICNSTNLENEFSGFYRKAAIALEAQFRFLEEETIQVAIRDELRQAIACFVCAGRHIGEVQNFTKTVNKLMGWALTGEVDDGDDSDGPVIVDMD